MLGVTLQNSKVFGHFIKSSDRVGPKKEWVILRSPRATGCHIPRFPRMAMMPEISLAVHRSSERRPPIAARKRISDSWDFPLGLCRYHLRRRAKYRVALVVIICCAAAIGLALGLLA